MGSDRTGCVSELTKLASECGCNISDSRMVAHNLELITMMKCTSGHKVYDLVEHYQAEFTGTDQPGILKAITAFFHSKN